MNDTKQILAFLDRVKATADAATEGPWKSTSESQGGDWGFPVFQKVRTPRHNDRDMHSGIVLNYGAVMQCFAKPENTEKREQSKKDSDFIASSRQRIPQLEQALRVAVGIPDSIRKKLREASKGEPDTWGFVSMFMDMIDSIEKETLHKIATLCHEPTPLPQD